jgi:hypothetical protein
MGQLEPGRLVGWRLGECVHNLLVQSRLPHGDMTGSAITLRLKVFVCVGHVATKAGRWLRESHHRRGFRPGGKVTHSALESVREVLEPKI